MIVMRHKFSRIRNENAINEMSKNIILGITII